MPYIIFILVHIWWVWVCSGWGSAKAAHNIRCRREYLYIYIVRNMGRLIKKINQHQFQCFTGTDMIDTHWKDLICEVVLAIEKWWWKHTFISHLSQESRQNIEKYRGGVFPIGQWWSHRLSLTDSIDSKYRSKLWKWKIKA